MQGLYMTPFPALRGGVSTLGVLIVTPSTGVTEILVKLRFINLSQ